MFRLQNYIISFLSFINAKTLVNSFILLERERERERERVHLIFPFCL